MNGWNIRICIWSEVQIAEISCSSGTRWTADVSTSDFSPLPLVLQLILISMEEINLMQAAASRSRNRKRVCWKSALSWWPWQCQYIWYSVWCMVRFSGRTASSWHKCVVEWLSQITKKIPNWHSTYFCLLWKAVFNDWWHSGQEEGFSVGTKCLLICRPVELFEKITCELMKCANFANCLVLFSFTLKFFSNLSFVLWNEQYRPN